MRTFLLITLIMMVLSCYGDYPDGNSILKKVDQNLYSENAISTYRMIIHGRRATKTLEVKNWVRGENVSFSEYLSPPKDAGTKMLKLEDKLWIYDPGSDRTIQISGHMLRQSVMGSDLSYEDFMEENELIDMYDSVVIGEEVLFENDCWILELIAKVQDTAYERRKLWVDKEKFLPLQEERYAKSGKLLKKTEIREIFQLDDRWYPRHIFYKDMLMNSKGTELFIDEIELVDHIPESRFSKAALRK